MSKLVKSSFARSATFNHKEHADRIDQLNTQAQAARRIDVALGLYCFELKEIHLQPGQFGKWLAENKPHLARQHTGSKLWQPSRSLEAAMSIARSSLEVCGYKISDYISVLSNQIPRVRGICESGQLMLLPEEKLPEEFQKLREEIFALVDGKSQRQLLSEFKQMDDDTGKPKRGRLKGSTGLTKEMREKAAQRAEQERLNELEETIIGNIDWLLEIADAKNLGMMDGKLLKKFADAADTASGFAKRVLESRTTNGGAK
jgi:hypothetical protein